jgi:hypothetical protein
MRPTTKRLMVACGLYLAVQVVGAVVSVAYGLPPPSSCSVSRGTRATYATGRNGKAEEARAGRREGQD